MCSVSSIPYLQELLIGLILVLAVGSFFFKERCPCKEEIAALKEEIRALREDRSAA